MSKITYVYNQKTCQYERAQLSVRDVIVYVIGLGIMSFVFFAALTFLYNYLLETDTEKALRAENKTIIQYKPVLEQKLALIQGTLNKLKEKDQALYAQLFNTPQPVETFKPASLPKDKVLLADASDFKLFLGKLDSKTSELFAESWNSNVEFGKNIHITQDEMELLNAMPSLPPIRGVAPENLASGFGDRVNPFHKGTYFHPGVDFSFPRGTEIVAAAAGTVTVVKHSDLQAGYGNYIEIDHGKGFISRYAHLDDISVKQGQRVAKGTAIGTLGSSGGSVAPHLHYEVLRDGEQVNPVLFMIETTTTGTYGALLQKSKKQNQSLD